MGVEVEEEFKKTIKLGLEKAQGKLKQPMGVDEFEDITYSIQNLAEAYKMFREGM